MKAGSGINFISIKVGYYVLFIRKYCEKTFPQKISYAQLFVENWTNDLLNPSHAA